MHIHTFCDHQEGNYGPIKNEIFEEGLQVVEGALPKELDGAYVRSR
jgi:carotenoid cleavage dioxygenase-like enzyme